MYQAIKDGNFKNSLKIGKNLFKKFLRATYNSYYSVNYAITSNDIYKFIESISELEGFPFSNGELKSFLTTCDSISFEQEGLEKRSRKIFEKYSRIFDKFKLYIEGKGEGMEGGRFNDYHARSCGIRRCYRKYSV